MTEVETELDSRFEDIDVESILARCERRGPLTFTRKRILYQAPEFIKRLPATETVEEGSTVTFGCKVVGFPNPTITWYKDDDVIGSEARATIETDDSGKHSIHIADVSKCDGGTYKICASNLEGSSTSSLYITVKAKSKLRSKKKNKRKGRKVARTPLFPAIIEQVAEEKKETLAVQLQPESPLTPIYNTISRKDPVMWPAFLGDWAYSNDEILKRCEIEDMELGGEDVFDAPSDVPTHHSPTFDTSAHAHAHDRKSIAASAATNTSMSDANRTGIPADKAADQEVINNIGSGRVSIEHEDSLITNSEHSNCNGTPDPLEHSCHTRHALVNGNTFQNEEMCDEYDDVIGSERYLNQECTERVSDISNNNNMSNGSCVPSNNDQNAKEDVALNRSRTEYKTCQPQPETISVNRSYARGNSTFSVAKRSPSPFSRSRKPVTDSEMSPSRRGRFHFGGSGEDNDTSTLQNLSNERILSRMRQNAWWFSSTRLCEICNSAVSAVQLANFDDNLLEIMFLISGSTFIALCLEIPPFSYVSYILFVMFVKLVLCQVLKYT